MYKYRRGNRKEIGYNEKQNKYVLKDCFFFYLRKSDAYFYIKNLMD